MMDQNQNNGEPVNVPAQTGQMSTADIAFRGNRDGGDITQANANRAPREALGESKTAAPLLAENETKDLRSRWTDIQAGFVDTPRESVESADALVATVMQRIAETFANERTNLEGQWSRGDNVSTEDLRVALQRYRSFFDRLLKL